MLWLSALQTKKQKHKHGCYEEFCRFEDIRREALNPAEWFGISIRATAIIALLVIGFNVARKHLDLIVKHIKITEQLSKRVREIDAE